MVTKSFLRWAGSKKQLLPELSVHWKSEEYLRYMEPFMGSAKLFLSMEIKEAILSDINPGLIETFNQVKKSPSAVFKILKTYEVSEPEYYRIRSIDPCTLGSNQRAARFIYLNKLCFNGLYRTNSKGVFNVPYSGLNKIDYESEYEVIKAASKKLSNAKIICGDFEEVIKKHIRQGDFVYLDPPYAVENRRIFNQYGPQTFGINDLNRMKSLLEFIEKRNAKFLLSYAYCKEALLTFQQWPMKKKFIQRNISGFAKYRQKAAELLVSNAFNNMK